MADWLISYGSWCLAPFGLLGMYVVGRRKTWGWLLALTTQCLWALYAVGTGQYGFLLGTTAYAAVYLRNWLGWRKAAPDGRAAEEVAALVAAGRADDLLTAYSDHSQSCAYVAGLIDHVAEDGSWMTAQEFARSLQEEAAK